MDYLLLPAFPKDVKFQVWVSFGRRFQETGGCCVIFGFMCRHTGRRYHQKLASFQILIVVALMMACLDGHLWFISVHSLRKDVGLTYCFCDNMLLSGNEGREQLHQLCLVHHLPPIFGQEALLRVIHALVNPSCKTPSIRQALKATRSRS